MGWFFFVFHLTDDLGKGLSSCLEDDGGHSNTDNTDVTLLPVLFFHLMNLIPVCIIYPEELFQDHGIDKTSFSTRGRGEHRALFFTFVIRTN